MLLESKALNGKEAEAMSYPYPSLVPLLKVLTTPAEYIKTSQSKDYKKNPDFLKILPEYTYAYCPFCRTEYREPANTYQLKGWGGGRPSPTLYPFKDAQFNVKEAKHCAHFIGIRKFINLHGVDPDSGRDTFDNTEGEIPFVDSGFFVYEDIKAYVVVHALPICRVETEQFVPSYTVFIMTYFGEQPQEIVRRIYERQIKWINVDPSYEAALVANPGFVQESSYDLSAWAAKGALGFLDFTLTNLELNLAPGLELPDIYRSIQGSRKPFVWRKDRSIVYR